MLYTEKTTEKEVTDDDDDDEEDDDAEGDDDKPKVEEVDDEEEAKKEKKTKKIKEVSHEWEHLNNSMVVARKSSTRSSYTYDVSSSWTTVKKLCPNGSNSSRVLSIQKIYHLISPVKLFNKTRSYVSSRRILSRNVSRCS